MRVIRCDRCEWEGLANRVHGDGVADMEPVTIKGRGYDLCRNCFLALENFLSRLPKAAPR